jgi:hypothetical protein
MAVGLDLAEVGAGAEVFPSLELRVIRFLHSGQRQNAGKPGRTNVANRPRYVVNIPCMRRAVPHCFS